MDSPVASSSRTIPQPFPSSSSRKREEDLVYLFEAEEERITNGLSRKLERLKEEKVELENMLEAENESHVNRLSREISSLRAVAAQAQQQSSLHGDEGYMNGRATVNGNGNGAGSSHRNGAMSFAIPPQAVMLEAMTRENEALRNRLADTERNYVELSRLNDVYRRELIDLRRRLGLPIDNLIGLSASSPTDMYSQPTHLRSSVSSVRRASSLERSPNSSTHNPTSTSQRPQLSGLPIPIAMSRMASSQTHRPSKPISSSTTPNTTSSSPSVSLAFPFSPVMPTSSMRINGRVGATTSSSSSSSYQPNSGGLSLSNTHEHEPSSYLTEMTTPPSSTSPVLQLDPSTSTFVAVNQLSYPSVPPPSLSSSLGSPVYSRRNSFGQSHARRMSGSGARVAETGSLIRGRRMSSAAGGALSTETVPESEPESPEQEPEPHMGSSPSSVVALSDLDLGR
ncbi:hypothetical protein FRB94_007678 [Tulasnella sp. JGI-2019a]|nr:hypothetical protein FRB94_007678 [Tulasnella sp. JGI-2019a]KAG9024565.1 hypothetical protein FRB95_011347 [Tulasnella sp. JGI-2019a]